jgi:branched-chain amino acid transport system permease protein
MSVIFDAARRGTVRENPVIVLFVLVTAMLAVTPFVTGSYMVSVVIFANYLAIAAMSWDFLAYTGELSFGHSFFLGIGGYTSALLGIHFGLPIPITVAAAVLASVAAGLLLGFPALRLTGPYLSLITLFAPVLLRRTIIIFSEVTNGEGGLVGVPSLEVGLIGEYYVSYLLMLITAVALLVMVRSNVGLIFQTIAADEEATRSTGKSTTKYKLFAFSVSGAFAGLSGAMLAHFLGSISPASHVVLSVSIDILIAALLGGVTTIIGPIIGAYIVQVVGEQLRFLFEFREMLFLILALVIIYTTPRGLYGESRARLGEIVEKIRGK